MAKLTQELVKSLFDYRDGELYWKVSKGNQVKIGDKAGTLRKDGYYLIRINSKTYYTHRLIFLYHNEHLPKQIDHIDDDPSNNNIENLREATQSQNMMNRKNTKNSTSKFKGVSWTKSRNKWMAQIKINNKKIYLGHFTSESDAAIAYNNAAVKYFGDYANLNKIKSRLNHMPLNSITTYTNTGDTK